MPLTLFWCNMKRNGFILMAMLFAAPALAGPPAGTLTAVVTPPAPDLPYTVTLQQTGIIGFTIPVWIGTVPANAKSPGGCPALVFMESGHRFETLGMPPQVVRITIWRAAFVKPPDNADYGGGRLRESPGGPGFQSTSLAAGFTAGWSMVITN